MELSQLSAAVISASVADAPHKASLEAAQRTLEAKLAERRAELERELNISALKDELATATLTAQQSVRRIIEAELFRMYHETDGGILVFWRDQYADDTPCLIKVATLSGDKEKIEGELREKRWIANNCADPGAHVSVYSHGMAETSKSSSCLGYSGITRWLTGNWKHNAVVEVTQEGLSTEDYAALWVHFIQHGGVRLMDMITAFKGRYDHDYKPGESYWWEYDELVVVLPTGRIAFLESGYHRGITLQGVTRLSFNELYTKFSMALNADPGEGAWAKLIKDICFPPGEEEMSFIRSKYRLNR